MEANARTLQVSIPPVNNIAEKGFRKIMSELSAGNIFSHEFTKGIIIMTSRYNHLIQTGKIEAFDFDFQQCTDMRWHCQTSHPEVFFAIDTRKRGAKELVAQQICEWYDASQTEDQADFSYPGYPIWVLVDADSCGNTLKTLAPYEKIDWLVVQGFANEVTALGESPWPVYRSHGTLREAADHLMTWHTARLVQTLGEKSCFIVVSRDGALQNLVQFIREEGHRAIYCPRELRNIREVLDCLV